MMPTVQPRRGKPPYREAGVSLLGVLIGTFILVSGGLAVSQLMSRSEKAVGGALEKFVAANIAREGLELVQAKRDSNWFATDPVECIAGNTPPGRDECWVDDICGDTGSETSNNYQFIVDLDDTAGIVIVPYAGGNHDQLYRDSPRSIWTHIGQGNEATLYRRLMSVDCSLQTADPSLVTVTSAVRWRSRGQEQQVVVQEQLYNWYKQ